MAKRLMYSEPIDGRSRGRALVVKWKQSDTEMEDIRERNDTRKAEQKERYMKIRRDHTPQISTRNTRL